MQVIGGVTILLGIVLERRWRRSATVTAAGGNLGKLVDKGAEPAALVRVDPAERHLDQVGPLPPDDPSGGKQASLGQREADVDVRLRGTESG